MYTHLRPTTTTACTKDAFTYNTCSTMHMHRIESVYKRRRKNSIKYSTRRFCVPRNTYNTTSRAVLFSNIIQRRVGVAEGLCMAHTSREPNVGLACALSEQTRARTMLLQPPSASVGMRCEACALGVPV